MNFILGFQWDAEFRVERKTFHLGENEQWPLCLAQPIG